MVLFPITNPLYLCQDPFALQRLRSNGNQPELSSLTFSSLVSTYPAEAVMYDWELFGKSTWNMLTVCRGTFPLAVGWRVSRGSGILCIFLGLEFLFNPTWSHSVQLTFLPTFKYQRPSLCFTLFFCSSLVSSFSCAYLSSPLSALGSGLRLTLKRGRCTRGGRLNDFLLLTRNWMFIRTGAACFFALPVVRGRSQVCHCLWSCNTLPPTHCKH